MHRWMIGLGLIVALSVAGCSGDEADKATKSMEDAASAAADSAGSLADSAGNLVESAGNAAGDMAHQAGDTARDAAGAVAMSAVDACNSFAEAGDWSSALEVCKEAHEMMPDDLALEHAYQQAKAAAGQ